MKQNIKFSVTIPAYKDKYLKETIDSVLAQTYQDYEVVIVNDASPYDLDSIVNQYTDPRIRYFKNEKNCGAKNVVDNWNICLSHATGDYLICMGDDDNLTPRCLQDFAELIEKYPELDLYHARSEIIDDDSNFVCVLEERPEWLPYGWQSDDISAFIAAASHGVANTKEPGFQYRGNGLSISHDLTCIEDKIEAVRFSIKWRLEFVADKHPNNADDEKLIELIKRDALSKGNQDIDDMVEFDIRKHLWSRSWFWLWNRQKHDISMKRYLRCVLKTIKYRLR